MTLYRGPESIIPHQSSPILSISTTIQPDSKHRSAPQSQAPCPREATPRPDQGIPIHPKPSNFISTTQTNVALVNMADELTKSSEKTSNQQTVPCQTYRDVSKYLKSQLTSAEKFKKTDAVWKYACNPIENSNKLDHKGRITILAAGIERIDRVYAFPSVLPSAQPFSLEISKNDSTDNSTASFDMEWPVRQEYNDKTASSDLIVPISSNILQVSIRVWPSLKNFQLFKREKVDDELRKMLGKLISKSYGLIIRGKSSGRKNDRPKAAPQHKGEGLYLRIEELEKTTAADAKNNKEHSCICITSDMEQILDFLGLDIKTYADLDNFNTWDDLMNYAVTCRFFNLEECRPSPSLTSEGGHKVEPLRSPTSQEQNARRVSDSSAPTRKTSFKGDEENSRNVSDQMTTSRNASAKVDNVCANARFEQDRKTKKSMTKEKKAVEKGIILGYWINDFLPTHASKPNTKSGRDSGHTREAVLREILQHFPEFAANMQRRKMYTMIRTDIVPEFVKDPSERIFATKGLEALIRHGKDAFQVKATDTDTQSPCTASTKKRRQYGDLDFNAYVSDEMLSVKTAFDNHDVQAFRDHATKNWAYAAAAQKWTGMAKGAAAYRFRKAAREAGARKKLEAETLPQLPVRPGASE